MNDSLVSKAFAEFKLSITRAMADQLAEALDQLEPAPLTKENVEALEARPGVYELYLRGERVYVGKASKSKSSKDLPGRLGDHIRKLSGRQGITLDDMSFQCLYVDEDLEAAAPETMLINKYKDKAKQTLPWNFNGFGNNDPGRNRDHSLVKSNHFDAWYPADLDVIVSTGLEPGAHHVTKYLEAVKAALPFNLRYDSKALSPRKTDMPYVVEMPDREVSARELVRRAVEALPQEWQATVLPGYVILYQEESYYRSARLYWSKDHDELVETEGANLRDPKGEVIEESYLNE
ncbi:Eco29kI restriction endonuclease [Actinopolyspora lacussalsi subsp. righensis]|uniref:Eco29kI restriction endonuclease n=1 Tax=Actinopolyspora righensis TaxID=995060 RepID=A0A1I6XYW0_9ACTN|nr:Eco29kI family restriction endonuclease [Actinopolyspora righensis]SFT43263.1 Eco29kI restriction endonuclease [Actinopolyspora righensis]